MGSSEGDITLASQRIKIYIQDLTLSACQVNVGTGGNAANIGDNITVYDRRDEKDYTVRYINGECWMTQNLRLTGGTGTLALSSTYSNVSSYTMPAESTSGFNSFTVEGHICSSDNNIGCWYNYYSATAGTVFGNPNSDVATSDICPKNWHLPTGPNPTANTDFNKLVGDQISGWRGATPGLTAFSAVAGGYYNGGSLSSTSQGFWWSANVFDTMRRYYLGYGSGTYNGNLYFTRNGGFFVRCVRSS